MFFPQFNVSGPCAQRKGLEYLPSSKIRPFSCLLLTQHHW
nr:MAG TPA: hypothetical protein [Caudoviricetes sp.]